MQLNTTKEAMNSLGARLSSERRRLGLTQEEFASLGSVRRQTQANYESNSSSPDSAYLSAIENAGVDIVYVLSGRQERSPIKQEILELAMVVVDDLLGKLNIDIRAETKARIIAQLYEAAEKRGVVDRDIAEAFIKIAAGTRPLSE